MDKLKPVLEHKFWIFFGIVLILPFVGYFMTKGPMAADIDSRWKAIDGVYSGIPSGKDSPNETWVKAVNDINDLQKLHNRQANEALWMKQKELMVWPKLIADKMAMTEYFKGLAPEQGARSVKSKYMEGYAEQLRDLWSIVDPLDDGKNSRDSNLKKKVSFAMDDLQQANTSTWGDFGPDFDQIWAAQEDIWLQTELLSAVKRINENCSTQHEAFVKQMGKVTLFGGTRSTGDAAPAQTTGAGLAGDPSGAAFGMGGAGFSFGSGKGSGSGGAGSAEVSLAEEFNASIETSGGSGGNNSNNAAGFGANATAAFAGATAESSGASSGSTTTTGAGATGAKTEIKRYIDDDPNLPYKRRGFSIKVVMDHRKVPEFLAELMNSPYPVEIIRVHQSWYTDTGSGTGQMGMMAASGAGPGGFTSPAAAGFGGGAPAGLATDAFATAGSTEDSSGGSGTGARPNANTPTVSAMSDPNLASVAIVGVWTLYRPVAADPNQPATNPTSPQGTPPNLANTPSVEPAAEESSTTASTAEPADSEKKADAAEANAGSEKPADPDKPESEKPAEDEKPADGEPDSKPKTVDKPETQPTEKTSEPATQSDDEPKAE